MGRVAGIGDTGSSPGGDRAGDVLLHSAPVWVLRRRVNATEYRSTQIFEKCVRPGGDSHISFYSGLSSHAW